MVDFWADCHIVFCFDMRRSDILKSAGWCCCMLDLSESLWEAALYIVIDMAEPANLFLVNLFAISTLSLGTTPGVPFAILPCGVLFITII